MNINVDPPTLLLVRPFTSILDADPLLCTFEFQIKNYEKTECLEERRKLAKEVYDNFIMKEMLSHTHVSPTISLVPGNDDKRRHYIPLCDYGDMIVSSLPH